MNTQSRLESLTNFRWNGRKELKGYLQVDFDSETAEAVMGIEYLTSNVSKAIASAGKKSANWLVNHSIKEISQALGIKSAPLKKRFYVREENGNIHIWFGFLEIELADAAKVTQNAAGVRAAKQQFDSGFIASIYGTDRKAYIRAKANLKHNYPSVHQRRNRKYHQEPFMLEGNNRSRFPVQRLGFSVEDPGLDIVLKYERRLNKYYRDCLDLELANVLNRN